MTRNPCPQDVWVCNAGQSQQVKRPLAETAPAELQSIVDTNLTGENEDAGERGGRDGQVGQELSKCAEMPRRAQPAHLQASDFGSCRLAGCALACLPQARCWVHGQP